MRRCCASIITSTTTTTSHYRRRLLPTHYRYNRRHRHRRNLSTTSTTATGTPTASAVVVARTNNTSNVTFQDVTTLDLSVLLAMATTAVGVLLSYGASVSTGSETEDVLCDTGPHWSMPKWNLYTFAIDTILFPHKVSMSEPSRRNGDQKRQTSLDKANQPRNVMISRMRSVAGRGLNDKYNVDWNTVLGEGAYGSVHPARLALTGEKVRE
jgi:hypothetical protein